MKYQRAYYHLFNRITQLIENIEACQPLEEKINVVMLLKQIQAEGEEICIGAAQAVVHRAPRQGGT